MATTTRDGLGGRRLGRRGTHLVEAAVVSAVFYTILYALIRVAGGPLTAEYVFIALVPFIVLLVSSDRIEQIRAGSLLLTLRNEARRAVAPTADESIEVDDAVVMAKGGTAALEERVRRERPSTISFRIGAGYDPGATEEYVAVNDRLNPAFRYVLFLAEGGGFAGVTTADAFRPLLETDPDALLDDVRSGAVLDHPDVVTTAVPVGAPKREALRRMAAVDRELLPVVDAGDRFVGVVTQDEISRDLLLSVLEEAAG